MHHPQFGREVRVIQLARVQTQMAEIDAWSEALTLRKRILTKHWNPGKSDDQVLSSLPAPYGSQPQQTTAVSPQQEHVWRLGSLAPAIQPPVLFCSFDKEASVLKGDNNIVETDEGISLSQVELSKDAYQAEGSGPKKRAREPSTSHTAPSNHTPPSHINLNTVFYGESFRELQPCLTHRIPRRYDLPRRILTAKSYCRD